MKGITNRQPDPSFLEKMASEEGVTVDTLDKAMQGMALVATVITDRYNDPELAIWVLDAAKIFAVQYHKEVTNGTAEEYIMDSKKAGKRAEKLLKKIKANDGKR